MRPPPPFSQQIGIKFFFSVNENSDSARPLPPFQIKSGELVFRPPLTPGVTHVGACHRPSDGHFFILSYTCSICHPRWWCFFCNYTRHPKVLLSLLSKSETEIYLCGASHPTSRMSYSVCLSVMLLTDISGTKRAIRDGRTEIFVMIIYIYQHPGSR